MKKHSVVMLLIVFVFALVLTACTGEDSVSDSASTESTTEKSSSDGKELVVVDWGGTTSEAAKKTIYEPFEKKHGVKVKVVSPSSQAKLRAMVETGNVTWDVVQTDPFVANSLGKQDILEKIDYNVVNTDGIYPNMVYDYGVGYQIIHHNIAYNSDEYTEGKHPESWADFYDTEKFPGARGIYDNVVGTIEHALLSDGVEPNDLYPLDLDRAFERLDKIKDVTVWWSTGAQPPQLLDSKEVVVSHAWSARIAEAANQGLPVANEYNQAIEWYNAWVVPKGAPNEELAMEFINFAVSAEVQAEYFKLIYYAPANEDAISLLPKEKQDLLIELAGNETIIKSDQQWWADNFDDVRKRFDEWLLK